MNTTHCMATALAKSLVVSVLPVGLFTHRQTHTQRTGYRHASSKVQKLGQATCKLHSPPAVWMATSLHHTVQLLITKETPGGHSVGPPAASDAAGPTCACWALRGSPQVEVQRAHEGAVAAVRQGRDDQPAGHPQVFVAIVDGRIDHAHHHIATLPAVPAQQHQGSSAPREW